MPISGILPNNIRPDQGGCLQWLKGIKMNTNALLHFRGELMEKLDIARELSDEEIREAIDAVMLGDKNSFPLTLRDRTRLREELFCSVRKLDVLQELIDDDSVTEIMVNGPDSIFIERDGKVKKHDRSFTSLEKLEDVIQQIVGRCNRVVNESAPIVDARLAGGARVNAVVPPASIDGPVLTIRRFSEKPVTMERLIAWDSITEECASSLEEMVKDRFSIVIGGGTGSGKTTFLGALSGFIPEDERIITIEDNAELRIQGIPNLVRLEAKSANTEGGREITIRDLIRTALRMRPDRIIVGECRGPEALDMLQAMNTGHAGSLGTAHANSCPDMLIRLETMVLMGASLPLEAIRRQIASGVDILVHLGRMKDKSRKVIEVAEITGMCGGEVELRTLFQRGEDGKLIKCGDPVKRRDM